MALQERSGGASAEQRSDGGAPEHGSEPAFEEQESDGGPEGRDGNSSSHFMTLAVTGGVLTFCVIMIGTLIVGGVSGFEADVLLASMLDTARFLFSAVITASATILALMLTLLSVSFNTESRLKPGHYHRVKQIALFDTVAFVTAMVFLLFLVVPLTESGNAPATFYQIYYYAVLAGSAVQGGLVVTIVIMLYTTVRDMIVIFGFGDEDHPLVDTETV